MKPTTAPSPQRLNRRRFLQAGAALTAAAVVPRHVLGGPGQVAPSDRLNVAVIGTGGQGITNIQSLLPHPDVNLTAICDVAEFWDNSHLYYTHDGGRGPAQKAIKDYYQGSGENTTAPYEVYVDYRVMLEKGGNDIDAVLIAAPNHIHGIIIIGKPILPTRDKRIPTSEFKQNKFGPQSNSISSIIRGFKGACTKQIREKIDPSFQWQRRFYDHIIRDLESLENIRSYIRNNPDNWKEDELR